MLKELCYLTKKVGILGFDHSNFLDYVSTLSHVETVNQGFVAEGPSPSATFYTTNTQSKRKFT